MNYNKPEPLSLTGNLAENWRVFRESYDIYMEETGLATTNNETKVSILLHFVGKEGLSLYNTFMFETPEDSKKIDSVIKAFVDYCKPIKNSLHARNVFYKRYQKEDESIEEFFSACKTLFEDCEFGSEDETILRDKLVMDTTDADTRNWLIEKGDVTLNEAIEALRIAEVQCRELKQIQLDEEVGNVVGAVQLKKELGNVHQKDTTALKYKDVKNNNYVSHVQMQQKKNCVGNSDNSLVTKYCNFTSSKGIWPALVPWVIVKTTKVDASKNKTDVDLKTEYVIKNVMSILNKITPENKDSLTNTFKALPIDSCERLEKTVDLVFEKAIGEQTFAPLYASLCHAMQGVQVKNDCKTTSFKKIIISKCQSLFELVSGTDPEKKKELQTEFEENVRRLSTFSVGNVRFIGELFKQKILTPYIMLYCIKNLITKHGEDPLKCLCTLLKTVGKELEQTYYLNEIFDKLKELTEMKSKIPARIRFMIQDIIDLRKDKWIPRRNKPKLVCEIENDAKSEAIERWSSYYKSMELSCNRPEK